MIKLPLTRRSFVLGSSAAGASMFFANAQASSSLTMPRPVPISKQRKALVFIMLDGGNDSFNMLVPNEGSAYRQYKKTRSNLAHRQQDLLALDGYEDKQGRSFGLHNAMPEVRDLFSKHKLAFAANIGPLIEPVSKNTFHQGTAKIPVGLLSHSDQFKHWQTSRPEARLNEGWFGHMADSLQTQKAIHQIPMNISMAGNNILQRGIKSTPYSITEEGSVGLIVNEMKSDLNELILQSFENILNTEYNGDPFKESYLSVTREAQAQHSVYKKATSGIRVTTPFSDSPLSQQLRKVAQTIKASEDLGHDQQTFFIRYIGWDHHDELLNNHAAMLRVLSAALGEFQMALEELDLADQVITFTGSDFGRTLTSNGNGTDHGWGGNTIIMGNPIDGGKIYGEYPSLALGDENELDVGDGVLIPTTSTDQLYADFAQWFGVQNNDLTGLFPNLNNFQHPTEEIPTLKIIKS